MLAYDPEQRVTAQEALKHPCFRGLEEIYEQRFTTNVPVKKKKRSDSQEHLPPIGRNLSLPKKPVNFLNQSELYGKDRRTFRM